MGKYRIYKGGSLFISLISVVTFSVAGFASQALAATATISNTGPDSENVIQSSNKINCEVTNTDTVHFENDVDQEATTGDATVSGNTVGSDWNDWNPVTWQNHGYTYDQWRAAFMAYMSATEGSMRANWGNMSGGGGSARSGDATNSNTTEFSVSIDNGTSAGGGGGICAVSAGNNGHGGTPGKPGTDGSDSSGTGGAVLGASSDSSVGGSIFGSGIGGAGFGGHVQGSTGPAGTFGSTGGGTTQSSGTGGSGSSGTPGQPGTSGGDDGDSASISNTGPDSYNAITSQNTYAADVTNTNTISTSSWVVQSASSGDTTVSQNTSSGSAGSGDAGNANGTSGGVDIQN